MTRWSALRASAATTPIPVRRATETPVPPGTGSVTELLRALLIANGDPPSARLAQHERDHAHLVLAVDGGAATAHRLGIEPHIVCGDFDSISLAAAGTLFPRAEIVELPDQELA